MPLERHSKMKLNVTSVVAASGAGVDEDSDSEHHTDVARAHGAKTHFEDEFAQFRKNDAKGTSEDVRLNRHDTEFRFGLDRVKGFNLKKILETW